MMNTRVRSRVASVLLFGLLALGAQRAAAQDSEPVRVTLVRSEPGFQMRIRDIDQQYPELACASTCSARLRPGTYQVGIIEGTRVSWQTLYIGKPGRILVTPLDRTARDIGAGLVIAGAVLTTASVLVVGSRLMCSTGHTPEADCGPRASDEVLTAGVLGLPAGVILGVAGIVTVATNLSPSVYYLSPRRSARIQPILNVGVGKGSVTSLGASLTF